MEEKPFTPLSFPPVRRNGLLFHAAIFLLLAGIEAIALYEALHQPVNLLFVLLLLAALFLFAPLPWIIYRMYALLQARYVVERDGLHFHWGLHTEDIAINEVEWVRPSTNLPVRLPMPRSSWPGVLSGKVHTDELGEVEYLASGRENLLLIATPGKVFAISPQDPNAFSAAVQRAFEMGSLTPIANKSVLPVTYLNQVWSYRTARNLLLLGFVLVLVAFIAVGMGISSRGAVSFDFSPSGARGDPVPSTQAMLLPILAGGFYLLDAGLGLYFFRRPTYQLLAYVLWAVSNLTTLLFILASAFLFL